MAKHISDSILLERYVSRREEAAFVDLVKRHGPRVEGTCRALLRNEHDVEDVFQATFLVLARKAAGIPWRDSVGSWLCAVAHRLAMNARADASRHRRRETPFANLRSRDEPTRRPPMNSAGLRAQSLAACCGQGHSYAVGSFAVGSSSRPC
jgi:DNA-directed RNA polymerase specialized sigma24 family protein